MAVDPRIQAALDAPMTTPTDLKFRPKRGYAQPPGTGPVGMTCRGCRKCHPTGSDYREWICSIAGDIPKLPISRHERACGRFEARS